ncbi:MAG: NAD(P)H-hydrate epimerase [Planctomycetales bacterium]|nr:NAD(P)H-hydrate epimerase [Planctomycetales bacterium]
MSTLTRQQARQIDTLAIERYGLAGIVLMENAGRGVADVLCGLGASSPVVICCGKGNNAGDGFVIARHLDLRGIAVRVLLWSEVEELPGDALANYRVIEKSGVAIERFGLGGEAARLERALEGASWIVDALLGTGARGAPRPPLDEVIVQLNAHPAPILAVDLPSGLDCDTGLAAGAVIEAAHTCTFVAAKRGFLSDQAARCTGQIHVLDIGAPRILLEGALHGL